MEHFADSLAPDPNPKHFRPVLVKTFVFHKPTGTGLESKCFGGLVQLG